MGNHQSSTCSNEQRRRTRSGIGRSGGPYVFGDIEVDGGTDGHMADFYISVLNTLLTKILPQTVAFLRNFQSVCDGKNRPSKSASLLSFSTVRRLRELISTRQRYTVLKLAFTWKSSTQVKRYLGPVAAVVVETDQAPPAVVFLHAEQCQIPTAVLLTESYSIWETINIPHPS